MNELSTIAGLPIPPKEKAMRWLGYAAPLALGVAAVITFMPYINKALGLLVNGVWSFAELLIAGGVACAVAFALLKFAPAYKLFIESRARKATWAVFGADPITPLVLWLKEVRADNKTVETEFENCEGTIANTQQTINDNLVRATKGDKLFAAAVNQYGEDSSEARLQALEPARLRETAESIQQRLVSLEEMRDILKEVVEATRFTERAAELEVAGLQQELEIGDNLERAQNGAERVISGRSERRANAEVSMKIIHDKYATQFGRLKGFRDLSRALITGVNLQQGVYHQEALARLKAESRLITGGKSPILLEEVPAGPGAGSFYKVPSQSRAARK